MFRFWGILHDGNRYDEKKVFYEDDVLFTDRFLQKTLQKMMWLSHLDSTAEDLALEKFLVRLWSHIEVLSLLSLEYAFEMSILFQCKWS